MLGSQKVDATSTQKPATKTYLDEEMVPGTSVVVGAADVDSAGELLKPVLARLSEDDVVVVVVVVVEGGASSLCTDWRTRRWSPMTTESSPNSISSISTVITSAALRAESRETVRIT